MRYGAALLLLSAAAHAHVVPFEFQAPRGAGNRSDGGVTLAWFDGNSTLGTADLYFSAVRPSWRPWSRVAPGVERPINAIEIPVSSAIDVHVWSTDGVPAGCWQPIARVQDPVEGVVTHVAPGVVTVADVGRFPASVWVDVTAADGGFIALVSADGDGPVTTALSLEQPDGAVVQVSAAAAREVAFEVPAGAAWYLHAVASSDAGGCDVWWQRPLYAPTPADDAGAVQADAGRPDAEPADAGVGEPLAPAPGCGCQLGSSPGLVALLALALRRRRGG